MLHGLILPLSSGDQKPPRQDLSDYWKQTERALEGLSDQFELAELEKTHLKNIGTIVFGQPVWTLMNNLAYTNWSELKEHVEEHFGLTES